MAWTPMVIGMEKKEEKYRLYTNGMYMYVCKNENFSQFGYKGLFDRENERLQRKN